MTYEEARDAEQLRRLEGAIADFIDRYKRNPSRTQRQTIILFPGALGSRLVRATRPYKESSGNARFTYRTVWLDLGTFLGNAITLSLDGDRDFQDRFIIADGPVELLGVSPYSRFLNWCDANGLDWFLFGWDWRRSLESTRDFFLKKFLPTFQAAVKNAGCPDPLDDFSLIGHSSGGMVLKLILHELQGRHAQRMQRAVTVATAFYGYGGQLHRFFEGEQYLNLLGKLKIIRVISSLPGGYVLMFLDGLIYSRDRPTDRYPSLDVDGRTMADPYAPQHKQDKVRYPDFCITGFDPRELAAAKKTCERLALPVPNWAKQKFFNFRGVRSRDDTVVSHSWDWIKPAFNPATDDTPITDGAPGAGDDTVPAWSGRHVGTPKGQVVDVTGDIHHMFIMEDDQTHRKLGKVLGLKRPKSVKRRRTTLAGARDIARPDEALAFIERLQTSRARPKSISRKAAAERSVARLAPRERERLARRILMDIWQHPAPRQDAPRKPKRVGAKTRKAKSRRPKSRRR